MPIPATDYPFFWGHADESEGNILNLPLPRGTDWQAYEPALIQALDWLARHSPELLIVSYGADTHEADPISHFKLKTSDYAPMARRIAALRLPTAIVMEGGYAIEALGAERRGVPKRLLGTPSKYYFDGNPSELLRQLRHDREQIADQADIGDLEDRRFLVLVDGDDDLRILHPREVLDRARNADRDIDVGGDDLAGLADLIIVRRIARIDRGARCADRGAELVGERIEQRWNCSCEPSARPPETMTLALVSSGRSLLLASRPTKSEPPLGAPASIFSTVPEPPSAAALSKPVVRTVMTFLASFDLTVAMALPA